MPLNIGGKKPASTSSTLAAVKPKSGALASLKVSGKPAPKTTIAVKSSAPAAEKPKGTIAIKGAGTATPKKGSIAFLKKGGAASQAFVQEEAKQEQQKLEAGKLWRFFMKSGEDRTITFLDGEIGEDGLLDAPNYYEHQIKVNGKWTNFVCTADVDTSQPCPICEKGDSKASLVALLTVIDHTPHTIQSGQNAGNEIKNSRKLFACKMKTLKALTKIAAKRGGLAGCTFDVSRTGDKEPGVGNNFDFTHKWESWEDFKAEFELDDEGIAVADYDEEISYLSPEELVKMGVGKAFTGIGVKKNKVAAKDLEDEL